MRWGGAMLVLSYYVFVFATLCFVVCCLLNTFLLSFCFSNFPHTSTCSFTQCPLTVSYLSWITMSNLTNTENIENISIFFLFVWPHPCQNTIVSLRPKRTGPEVNFPMTISFFKNNLSMEKWFFTTKLSLFYRLFGFTSFLFFKLFKDFLWILIEYHLFDLLVHIVFLQQMRCYWVSDLFKLKWGICLVQFILMPVWE